MPVSSVRHAGVGEFGEFGEQNPYNIFLKHVPHYSEKVNSSNLLHITTDNSVRGKYNIDHNIVYTATGEWRGRLNSCMRAGKRRTL